MREVITQADWVPIPAALVFTAISYFFVSFAFAYVSHMLGIKMGKRELSEVCFVSTVTNHVLSTGGMAGYSIRFLIMDLYGVSLKDALTSSIIHFYLTSLDMLSMLPVGFVYLMLNTHLPKGAAGGLGLMTLVFGLIFIVITSLIFVPVVRRPILEALVRLGRFFLRRDFRSQLDQYNDTLIVGTQAMRLHPMTVVWVMVFTWVDFICSIVVLGLCFKALGASVSAGALLSGFVVSIQAGNLSMVPGGFGVQETSMAGIFVLLGVPFQQAFLASILFRAIYYIVPYCISLGFYRTLLRRGKQYALIAAQGG